MTSQRSTPTHQLLIAKLVALSFALAPLASCGGDAIDSYSNGVETNKGDASDGLGGSSGFENGSAGRDTGDGGSSLGGQGSGGKSGGDTNIGGDGSGGVEAGGNGGFPDNGGPGGMPNTGGNGGHGGGGHSCVLVDCDDGNPCTTETCAEGICIHHDNTALCASDGNPCTSDICSGGNCTHPTNGICECVVAGDCNDDNSCTVDSCLDNQCIHANACDAGGIDAPLPSAGCGMDAPQTGPDWMAYTLSTTGTKTHDHAPDVAGPWTYERQYFIKLPVNYDKNTPYPVILQGPACGANGASVYGLNDPEAIRVGITPPPGNVWNGCFDDKMGDESVEWPLYEKLFDQLSATLCIDKHRVFATGNSTGSFWANELACIYGNDPVRPIRGIAVNSGGLPVGIESPTCNGGKFAGIWMHDAEDNSQPYSGTQTAITRALQVNGCTGDFIGPREPYPVAGQPDICERFTGCPARYPIVVCTQHGTNHGGNDGFANVAFPPFLLSL